MAINFPMKFLPFKIEFKAPKKPIINSFVKTDFYLVYEGDFGVASYFGDEFKINLALLTSPAEHLMGDKRY